jgi:CHAT domain-containing protein
MSLSRAEPRVATTRRGRAALRCLVATAAGLCLTAGAALAREPAGITSLEAAADQHRDRALPLYREAFELWGQIAELGRRLGDGACRRRADEARAALAANLLDPGLLEALGIAAPAAPWPLSAALGALEKPGDEARSLEQLARLLAVARRSYLGLAEREERDLPLIHEALALARRALADLHQLQADEGYRKALALAESGGAEPAAAAAAVRLRFKLRDFRGALDLAGRSRPAIRGLDDAERARHLGIVEAAARFLGEREEALAAAAELKALGDKAEGSPRPFARLAGLPVGSAADLAATAAALIGLLDAGRWRLSAREAALAAHFAALSALELGEYALAEDLLRSRASGPELDPWLRAAMLARLAFARDRLGDFEGALKAAREAETLVAGLERTEVFRARLVLNAASALLGLGKLDEALAAARGVLGGKELPLELRIRARLLIGAVWYEKAREAPERLKDAAGAFLTAEREMKAGGDDLPARAELEVLASIPLANILRREAIELEAKAPEAAARKRREAIERQDAALRRADAAGLRGAAAIAASNLGELYLEAGDLAAARSFVAWALERAREERSFETEWRCHWYLGRIAAAEGDHAAAERELWRAAEIIDSYRSRLLDAETKSGFMTDKMDLYRDMARWALERRRPAEAFEIAERARARALIESLGWRFVTLANPRETSLYREYVSLVGQEAKARQGGSPALLGVRAAALDHDLLRRRLTALRDHLLGAPELGQAIRALVSGAPATSAEVLSRLAPGAALIEYFSLGDALAAFVAAEGKIEAVRLPVRHHELRAPVRAFLAAGAGAEEPARRLHEMLLQPLLSLLPSPPAERAARVIIVPYGVLHQLPFEALRDARGLQIERWEISYLPSASLLKYLDWSRRAPRPAAAEGEGLRLLALADPHTDYNGDGRRDLVELAHARSEVAGFAPRFERKEVLTDRYATEGALIELGTEKDVIHLACHGEFYPQRPWDSTLFLAPGPSPAPPVDDGRLQAFEVYALDLRGNRLVALSGCETGRSELSGGDDPAGLATAFLHAGAASLLVSLWKVEDAATAELMKTFYRKWIDEGKDRVAALREAKLELARGAFPHPRQWSAFVLIGDR